MPYVSSATAFTIKPSNGSAILIVKVRLFLAKLSDSVLLFKTTSADLMGNVESGAKMLTMLFKVSCPMTRLKRSRLSQPPSPMTTSRFDKISEIIAI